MVLAAVAPVRSFANRERRPPRAGRIRPASPGKADRNKRVDPSPYYPVFGRRMVMIGYARRPRTRPKPALRPVRRLPAAARAAHSLFPRSRPVRLRPVRSPATPVTTPPAGTRLFGVTPAPLSLRSKQLTCSISVDCAIDRNTPGADGLISVSAEDLTPYTGQIFSTNRILVPPGSVGPVGRGCAGLDAARKTRRATISARRVNCRAEPGMRGSGGRPPGK